MKIALIHEGEDYGKVEIASPRADSVPMEYEVNLGTYRAIENILQGIEHLAKTSKLN